MERELWFADLVRLEALAGELASGSATAESCRAAALRQGIGDTDPADAPEGGEELADRALRGGEALGVIRQVRGMNGVLSLKDNQVPALFCGTVRVDAPGDLMTAQALVEQTRVFGLTISGAEDDGLARRAYMAVPVGGVRRSGPGKRRGRGRFDRFDDLGLFLLLLADGEKWTRHVFGVVEPRGDRLLEITPLAMWW